MIIDADLMDADLTTKSNYTKQQDCSILTEMMFGSIGEKTPVGRQGPFWELIARRITFG